MLVFSVDPAGLAERHLPAGHLRQGRRSRSCPISTPRRSTPTSASRQYQQEIRQKILDMYGLDKIPEEIESYIQAAAAEPAMEESAIFDEVVDIVVKGEYDYYIYDLVPLGHALYYLAWPRSTTSGSTRSPSCARKCGSTRRWRAGSGGTRRSTRTRSSTSCSTSRHRINTVLEHPHRQEKTAFFFVVMPEEMIIIDTLKAAELFAKFDVPLSGLHRQPGPPPELGQPGHPRVPAEPTRDAGPLP